MSAEDLRSYQCALRSILFDLHPADESPPELKGESWRWGTYRRMVRARLHETVCHAFERTGRLVGHQTLEGWLDRFLAIAPPRSPYLRDVPGELFDFLCACKWHASGQVGESSAVPKWVPDLMWLEWSELAVAYAPDGPLATSTNGDMSLGDLAFDRPLALPASLRLRRLAYPMHTLELGDLVDAGPADPLCALEASQVWVCLYRDPVTFDVRTLELSEIAAGIVHRSQSATCNLVDAIRASALELGAQVDPPLVDSISDLLADFVERGLVLGSWYAAATPVEER